MYLFSLLIVTTHAVHLILRHSDESIIIAQSHSPLLRTCFISSLAVMLIRQAISIRGAAWTAIGWVSAVELGS